MIPLQTNPTILIANTILLSSVGIVYPILADIPTYKPYVSLPSYSPNWSHLKVIWVISYTLLLALSQLVTCETDVILFSILLSMAIIIIPLFFTQEENLYSSFMLIAMIIINLILSRQYYIMYISVPYIIILSLFLYITIASNDENNGSKNEYNNDSNN